MNNQNIVRAFMVAGLPLPNGIIISISHSLRTLI